jgi:hypothetical protein
VDPPPPEPPPPPFTYFEGDTVSVFVNTSATQLPGAYAVRIDWDDGNVTQHALTPGQATRIDHVYLDDKPGLQTDIYVARLTFLYTGANFGGVLGESSVVFPVANVAPTVTLQALPPAGGSGAGLWTFTGSFTDPGLLDTHTLTWNFPDGTRLVTTDLNNLTLQRGLTRGGTVTLTVEDDDGGLGSASVFLNFGSVDAVTWALPAGQLSPTAAQLDALSQQARAAWAAAGADVSPLNDVRITVGTLGPGQLGVTLTDDQGGVWVVVDDDAAGRGWFVDPTPADADEFQRSADPTRWVALSGPAAGRMDLLTLITHEFGHVLGLDHVRAEAAAASVMAETLHAGERRLPVAADLQFAAPYPGNLGQAVGLAQTLLASGVTGGSFDDAQAWTLRASASIAGGVAVLAEGERFNSSLQQALRIPYGARFLEFDLVGWDFGPAGTSVGDAFEVALLDLNSGASLLGGIGLTLTDAALNIQADGRVHAAPGTTFDGAALAALPDRQGGGLQVRLDVSAVTTGTPALLSFDLLGFGARTSSVTLDNVRFVVDDNIAPVARPDSYTLPRDTVLRLDLLANDSDANGDFLSVAAVTAPRHGTLLRGADGSYTYRPNPGFAGTDSFSYRATDGQALSNLALVTLNVQAVNRPPVALPDAASTPRNSVLVIDVLANDSDPDGSALTVVLADPPASGSVALDAAGRVVYTPAPGFVGTDSFTYRASDGELLSDLAVVTVTVLPVNEPPVAVDDVVFTDEDTPVIFDVRDNDSDDGSAPLRVTITVPPQHGRVVMLGDGRLEYTPDPDFNGSDSLRYTVSDGELSSNEAVVRITVRPVNDAPLLLPVPDAVVEEGSTLVLNLQAIDVDGDTLSWTLTTAPAGATVGADGVFAWLAPDGPATETVTVRVTDPGGLFAERSFSITVLNVPPELTANALPRAVVGSPHVLHFAYRDVGDDAVQRWVIDWGDGTVTELPGTATSASHVYRAPAALQVQISAVDDDGTWLAPALPLQVFPVPVPPPPPPVPVPPPPAPLPPPPAPPPDAPSPVAPGLGTGGLAAGALPTLAGALPGVLRPAPGPQDGLGPLALTMPQLTPQSAHLAGRFLGFLVPGDRPGAAVSTPQLTRAQMAQAFEGVAAPADAPLQVGVVALSGGGFKLRFNQAVDLGRVSGSQSTNLSRMLVVERDGQVLPGTVVLDPDGRGLSFLPQGGPLRDGSYTVRLLSGDTGWATPDGRALDGDHDGRPGGDYLGRFTVLGGSVRAAQAAEGLAAVPVVDAVGLPGIVVDAPLVRSSLANEGTLPPLALWTALSGGLGGMLSLAFAPMVRPQPAAPAQRRVPRARRPERGDPLGMGALLPHALRDDPTLPLLPTVPPRAPDAAAAAQTGSAPALETTPAPALKLQATGRAPQVAAASAPPAWLPQWLAAPPPASTATTATVPHAGEPLAPPADRTPLPPATAAWRIRL